MNISVRDVVYKDSIRPIPTVAVEVFNPRYDMNDVPGFAPTPAPLDVSVEAFPKEFDAPATV